MHRTQPGWVFVGTDIGVFASHNDGASWMTSTVGPGTVPVEELIWKLRGEYTIIIVTHNMAQARRASEECAFMLMGKMIEHKRTEELFVTPENQSTADYIEVRYA